MLASYLLSRTIVPTMAKYLLRGHERRRARRLQKARIRWPGCKFASSMPSSDFATVSRLLERCLASRKLFLVGFLQRACCLCCFWCPGSDKTFFQQWTAGQFKLHLRARTGTRIEETARLCDLVEQSIREQIPQTKCRA